MEQVNKAPVDYDIFVLAQNNRDKLSPPSNMINAGEFVEFMPYRIAFNTLMKNTNNRGFIFKKNLKDIPTSTIAGCDDGWFYQKFLQYNMIWKMTSFSLAKIVIKIFIIFRYR